MSNSKRNLHNVGLSFLSRSNSLIYTIIIAGGEDNDDIYDDILEYDPEEDTITSVGHMTQARAMHAISVVPAEDYLQWCDGSL